MRSSERSFKKKLALLNDNFGPVLLSPRKTLDLSSHEGLFRALGLWNFAHLEFDREVRRDLLAHLIAYYDQSNRLSYVHGCQISVTRRDLCMAVDLPTTKEKFSAFERLNSINDIVYSDKNLKALLAFMSNYMLLVDNACCLPSEIVGAIELVKDGFPHKVDWGEAMWVLVERELLNVPMNGTCYYASYMQRLIKSQRPDLFSKEPQCIFRCVPEPGKEEICLEDDEDDLVEEVSFVEDEGDAEDAKMQSMDGLGNETTEKRISDLGLIQSGEENMVNCVGEGAKLFNEEENNGCVHFPQLPNRKASDSIDVDDTSEEDDFEKQKERRLDDLPVSAKLSDLNRTTSCDMDIHLEKNKVKRVMHVIWAEDEQFDGHGQPKRKRSCAPLLSNQPSTFHECLDLIQGGMRRAKALNAEKEEALENLETHVQHLNDVLREKEHMSRSLKKMLEDQRPNWQMAVQHYESEISLVSQIMLGYRRALRRLAIDLRNIEKSTHMETTPFTKRSLGREVWFLVQGILKNLS
ncbi:hypothetical protein HPP92_004847 [Vanilla planifolia]|uniref:Uncharacterized protein n=1 Tax=Vanilla planifolia TaxID=51239 RepID=A0A835VE15_VANPL|nr:hypothetical protein HPP92_004847 [Vanilla planifolia]